MMTTETLDLTVPEDMCILDFLAGLGDKTKNAWIFMDHNCIYQLEHSKGCEIMNGNNNSYILTWEGLKDMIEYSHFAAKEWYTVIDIDADDIEFEKIEDQDMPKYTIRLRKAIA